MTPPVVPLGAARRRPRPSRPTRHRRTLRRPTLRRPLLRRGTALAAAVVLPLTLAACGSDEVGAKPDLPTETPALWNPCDSLDTAFIRTHFGATTQERNGTETAPDCRFAPTDDSGEPVVTVNYQLFGGSLEELWESMGQQKGADVRTPRVKGADAARVVVDAGRRQLYVTGFVQSGELFQVVNVADPRPYDVDAVVAGVEATLAAISRQAVRAGIGTGD